MKLLLVTGTFDDKEGKESFIGTVLKDEAVRRSFEVVHYNGGHLTDFNAIMNDLYTYSVIVWMPHIDNAVNKMLPVIKKLAPKAILVSSKRVVEKAYTDFEVVGRLLTSHSNLGIVITKDDDYKFSLIDPLGNSWAKEVDLETLVQALFSRVSTLLKIKRVGSESIGPVKEFTLPYKFIKIVKSYGEKFDLLMQAVHKDRLLGNASTRCAHGFPAAKLQDHYFVSKRNISKALIDESGFVEVKNEETIVKYFGDSKPSVDTPIQIRIFNYFKNVNYIIHGHAYLKNCITTSRSVPCGSIEEFDELSKYFESDSNNFGVNLRGHGCLILAKDLEWLEKQIENLIARPFPETAMF